MQGPRAFGSDAAANFTFPFTLQQLIVLRTLAMSQTLDEAAAALSMSETNVRTTLSKLEKDLDVELFQAQVGFRPVMLFWARPLDPPSNLKTIDTQTFT